VRKQAAAELPPDDVLVAGLRAGDEATFVRLLDAWSQSMLRLARAFVSTQDSAEEVVQDAWLAVLRGIDRFEGRSALKTWVHRILVNTAKNRGVREKRTVPWSDLDAGPTLDPGRFQGSGGEYPGHWRQFPQAWPSPESAVLAGEVQRVIGAALAELPARQCLVLSLRDVDGHGSAEVCAMLEISAPNQRVLLHRARATVRARLETYFAGHPAPTGGA
jgi:RNA polymerase sigma-70 factor (ECF subfamily)